MKDVELRLVSELMKNSRRSDRELAKVLRVSQPTVSRAIKRLEKEGIIREYTMLPDFEKLGYKIVAFTLLKLKEELPLSQIEIARNRAEKYMQNAPAEIVLFERGLGGKSSAVEVTFHKDYASFQSFRNRLRDSASTLGIDLFDISESVSFLVNLEDKIHYRYFTLATLAKDLLESGDSA